MSDPTTPGPISGHPQRPVPPNPAHGGPAVPPPPATPARGSHDAGTTGATHKGEPSTSDRAKGAAKDVASDAQGAAKDVAGTAKAEAASVKDDALAQGRSLAREAGSTLQSQASDQLSRLAGGTRSVSDDLARLSRGEKVEQGLATDLAGQLNQRVQGAADWLENKEPSDVLDEVRRFARQRPFVFLGIAAGVGLLAGRLTRGVAENHTSLGDDASQGSDRRQLEAGHGTVPSAPRTTAGTAHLDGAPSPSPSTGGVAPVPPVGHVDPVTGASRPGQEGVR